jgi:hypothetical protein
MFSRPVPRKGTGLSSVSDALNAYFCDSVGEIPELQNSHGYENKRIDGTSSA